MFGSLVERRSWGDKRLKAERKLQRRTQSQKLGEELGKQYVGNQMGRESRAMTN